ncbi:hypothetical protein [Reinekea thalattae]|uniref:Uncharacterized protein n=1 Tax=Reinekea thalattae TaxID=2593301 RepID=A0A5C8Z1Z2_9GAMM|nr:hypothetical protein [Reinekea thalattae]TXR51251.1 hypothetical protein FME95_13515 [Reinekea thalattae]
MTQQLKQAYLKEMGIQPWFPRVALTNALAPLNIPAYDSVAEQDAALQSVATPVVNPNADTTVAESSTQLKRESAKPHSDLAPTKQSMASVTSTQTEPPVVGRTKPVRFGLGLYVIGDWLVASSLINDHALHYDASLSLIQSILNAIDGSQAVLSYHHSIAWPFFSSSNADQGLSAAKHYVTGVIEHLQDEHKTQKLLAFGGVLPKLNGWSDINDAALSQQCLILPSVYRMMDEPELKAKAWLAIQNSPYFSPRTN